MLGEVTMKKLEPWEWASVAGATVLAWYAMPDALRSKKWRSLAKIGLMGATAYAGAKIPEVRSDVEEFPAFARTQLVDLPPKTATAILVGGAAATTAITILAEKWLFARGELRRSKGVRGAHTRQALVLAGASAALAFTEMFNPWAERG